MSTKRPMVKGMSQVTTPRAAQMMLLLGAATKYKSLALTGDEFRAVKRLYGFKPELPNKKPDPPPAPDPESFKDHWRYQDAVLKHTQALKAHASWEDPLPMMQAGADRNVMRTVEADGLRLVTWIAKFVPPGEDPLAHLIQAAVAAGWDVEPEDAEWAGADFDEPDPDPEDDE